MLSEEEFIYLFNNATEEARKQVEEMLTLFAKESQEGDSHENKEL